MKHRMAKGIAGYSLSLLFVACASVAYEPAVRVRIPAVDKAVFRDGDSKDVEALARQLQRPDLGPNDRARLAVEHGAGFAQDLGDYKLIGAISAPLQSSDLHSLRAAICKRAAQEGGDVVLLVTSGEDTYVSTRTRPAKSTTLINQEMQAVLDGKTLVGGGRPGWETTHHPAETTYSETIKSYATALVFRHKPGEGRLVEVMGSDKARGSSLEAQLSVIWQDPRLGWEQALALEQQVVAAEGLLVQDL